ncbi:MAG: hypothetical protein A2Z03_06280 [Chloroflexi bacterium RBG_16_56_8]|nr:MAG: hypothetical protein A2Z03_06280 [Chloroflexi bacterium RBG_16_56_8]
MKLITHHSGLSHRRPRRPEAVEIQEKRFGYFPKVFRWHGKRYDVQAVERCWTVANRAPRLYFRVRCDEGMFDLYQDVRGNTWHLTPLAT